MAAAETKSEIQTVDQAAPIAAERMTPASKNTPATTPFKSKTETPIRPQSELPKSEPSEIKMSRPQIIKKQTQPSQPRRFEPVRTNIIKSAAPIPRTPRTPANLESIIDPRFALAPESLPPQESATELQQPTARTEPQPNRITPIVLSSNRTLRQPKTTLEALPMANRSVTTKAQEISAKIQTARAEYQAVRNILENRRSVENRGHSGAIGPNGSAQNQDETTKRALPKSPSNRGSATLKQLNLAA
jgi:hypothetical protein